MDAKSFRNQSRNQNQRKAALSGFTLVELLVVIVIIAMLAGLIATAAVHAIKAARRAVINAEINEFSMALTKYKSECGDYPPDCAYIDYGNGGPDQKCYTAGEQSQKAVVRHIRKRFPRYRPGVLSGTTSAVSEWYKFCADIEVDSPNMDMDSMNPSHALAFFLGGMPDEGRPTGFSTNPNNPFALGGTRTAPFIELDETRYKVDSTTGLPQYFPKYIKHPSKSSKGVPYVYFRARSGAYGPRTLEELHSSDDGDRTPIPRYPSDPSDSATDTEMGICVPYSSTKVTDASPKDSTKIDWYANKGFQIIAPGLDGQFGTTGKGPVDDPTDPRFDPEDEPLEAYRYFNTDESNLIPVEDDNLSSFTPGTLEDGVK